MSTELRISVQLLTGMFHGVGSQDQREWPPSPFRLFQALIAGCRTGRERARWTPARARAFEWLESLAAPRITAPRADQRNWYRIAVPNNDMDRVIAQWSRGSFDPGAAAKLKTMKELMPHEIPGGGSPLIHYSWDIGQGDESLAREMAEAARHLLALGHGEDLAAAEGVLVPAGMARPHGDEWIPSSTGPVRLRTPVKGSLQSLDRRHDAFLGRIDGKTIRTGLPSAIHGESAYATAASLAPRPHVAFMLARDATRPLVLPARRTHVASGLVRHVVIGAGMRDGRPEEWIRHHLAGHGDGELVNDRLSCLPLPSIGHEHADGAVRRVLVASPSGADPESVAWAAERLEGVELIEEGTGRVLGYLREAAPDDGVVEHYTKRARRWATVTPVILPGHDDRRRGKAEALFARAIEQAGLEHAVAEFALRREPYWPGTLHVRDYDVPPYLRGMGRWHADVLFREAVQGPIAIGAGRHVGLGLLATD